MGPPTEETVGDFLLPLSGWGDCCPHPHPQLCPQAALTCLAPTMTSKPRIQMGDFSPSSFSLAFFLFIFQIAALQPSSACWPKHTTLWDQLRQWAQVASRALGEEAGNWKSLPVCLPWAALTSEAALSSPITSGACLCSRTGG